MKNKIIIMINVVAIIVILIEIFVLYSKSDKNIIRIGNKLYGDEYCSGYNHVIFHCFAGEDYKPKCTICGKSSEFKYLNSIICKRCVEITDRCSLCGGKLDN